MMTTTLIILLTVHLLGTSGEEKIAAMETNQGAPAEGTEVIINNFNGRTEEYADAVISAVEQAPSMMMMNPSHNGLVRVKIVNQTSDRPITALTLEQLDNRGYTVENIDKKSGVITLRIKTPIKIKHVPPPVSTIYRGATTSKPTSTAPKPEAPKLFLPSKKTEMGRSTEKNDFTSTAKPTPRANYQTTTTVTTPPPAPTVEEEDEEEQLDLGKCPTFQDFINGSIGLFSGLEQSEGFKDGLNVAIAAAADAFKAMSKCAGMIASDVASFISTLPWVVSAVADGLFPTTPTANISTNLPSPLPNISTSATPLSNTGSMDKTLQTPTDQAKFIHIQRFEIPEEEEESNERDVRSPKGPDANVVAHHKGRGQRRKRSFTIHISKLLPNPNTTLL